MKNLSLFIAQSAFCAEANSFDFNISLNDSVSSDNNSLNVKKRVSNQSVESVFICPKSHGKGY
jgi:hypothetical protein